MSGSRGRSGARHGMRNNKRREAGERVVDGRGHSGGRFRRERMSPQQEPRETIPAQREGPERERVAWQRAEERMHWERIQQWRRQDLGKLERRSKREWSELYGRQERQREQLAKDCRWGAGALAGLAGAGRRSARDRRGDPGTNGSAGTLPGGVGGPGYAGSGFRLEKRIPKRCVRSRDWQEKSTAAVWKGQRDGRVRRRGGTPSQCMTVIVAETGPGSSARRREERMEQVREFDGEQAYEKMMQTMEEARQEKARQAERARAVERARLEWARQEMAKQSKERRGPERGGPERGLWPQPLGLVFCWGGVREWAERIREENMSVEMISVLMAVLAVGATSRWVDPHRVFVGCGGEMRQDMGADRNGAARARSQQVSAPRLLNCEHSAWRNLEGAAGRIARGHHRAGQGQLKGSQSTGRDYSKKILTSGARA